MAIPGDAATGNVVEHRGQFYRDRDRPLVTQHAELPTKRPIKLRLFLSGTVVEAFIDDRVVLSSRLYKHAEGAVALEAVDGAVLFDKLLVRRLACDFHPGDRVQ